MLSNPEAERLLGRLNTLMKDIVSSSAVRRRIGWTDYNRFDHIVTECPLELSVHVMKTVGFDEYGAWRNVDGIAHALVLFLRMELKHVPTAVEIGELLSALKPDDEGGTVDFRKVEMWFTSIYSAAKYRQSL